MSVLISLLEAMCAEAKGKKTKERGSRREKVVDEMNGE